MTGLTSRRRVAPIELVPRLGSRRDAAAWLLLTAGSYVALAVCAALPSTCGVLVAAVAVAAAEILTARQAEIVSWALQRTGLGPVARGLLRGVLLVLFAARTNSPAVTVCTAVAVGVIAAVNAVRIGAAQLIGYLRTPPIIGSGLPLGLSDVPPAPASWTRQPGGLPALVELTIAIGLAVAAGHSNGLAIAGLLVSVVLAVGVAAWVGAQALRLRRLHLRQRVSDAVKSRLRELQPQLVVYFGNGPEWRYQLEMWLRTLETLDLPVLVLIRDPEVLRTLAPTCVPVICIPGAGTLMQLELPSLRAALYVGNNGNNIHLLRRPGVRSVFIGHGDSDKAASSNPFARVYNEIWVAGPAGRARYADAGVGIAASAFVEVGRPQLGQLLRIPDAVPLVTVLYAPTWEGWGDDPQHSSLPLLGPDLIRELLVRSGVRVMYRPHPQTGHRDAAIRRAHREVVRLLRQAGADPAGAAALGPFPTGVATATGDVLDDVVLKPQTWSSEQHDDEVRRWTDSYWAANPGHRILTAPAPELYACFATADALISDVSSVTTDFLAADRPYAVVNVTNAPDEQFRVSSPAAAGGFVVGRDLGELDGLLSAAGGGIDPTASAREDARRYLLGPRTTDPADAFRVEVHRICAQQHGQRSLTGRG